MKYLARTVLMLAIVAVSLVAFTSAASVQAGSGGVTAAFHCQGPDVWGEATFAPSAPTLMNGIWVWPQGNQWWQCAAGGNRVVSGDLLVSASSYYVELAIHQHPGIQNDPDYVCVGIVYVGTHFNCDSPVTSAQITLQLR